MTNKQLILFDKDTNNDSHNIIKGTKVIIKDSATNETVFEGSNKFIIHGSTFTAMKHFPDLIIPGLTKSYNEALSLDETLSSDTLKSDRIVLFSMGIDGCGVDQHQVRYVDYAKWCAPKDLVPFRYVDAGVDDVDREIYYGRKDMSLVNGRIAYYFKKFDSNPQWAQRYKSDRLPIGSGVYDSARTDEIETFVELRLKISKDDVKEFFASTMGIEYSKINTISLLTATPDIINGITYYQNIRPITKINFPNETLYDLNKGLDIIYHIYY